MLASLNASSSPRDIGSYSPPHEYHVMSLYRQNTNQRVRIQSSP